MRLMLETGAMLSRDRARWLYAPFHPAFEKKVVVLPLEREVEEWSGCAVKEEV
ncbi:MAG: hypothetical protein MJ202_10825 [Lentisphaeria bacterium]|nr:hypothetical protein [Lentisphaeria bacterium]